MVKGEGNPEEKRAENCLAYSIDLLPQPLIVELWGTKGRERKISWGKEEGREKGNRAGRNGSLLFLNRAVSHKQRRNKEGEKKKKATGGEKGGGGTPQTIQSFTCLFPSFACGGGGGSFEKRKGRGKEAGATDSPDVS